VLFGSTRDGLPEIYEGDTTRVADPPRAVTTGPERAIWARYTPDGKSILFLRDARGDENHRIWRVGADGAGLTDLTPGEPMHRQEPIVPRKKADTMIYAASRHTSPETMLFEQKLEGGEPRLVATSPRPGGLDDVTADGTRALFTDLRGFSDITLNEVDLATGKLRRLYPAEGKAFAIASARYSADGARVFVTTDRGGDATALIALDAKTGKELGTWTPDSTPTATIRLLVSPRGDRLVAGLDCGTHGEVRILDARTLKVVTSVKVPLGDVQLGTYRADGKAFSLLVSLPDKPPDVWSVDAATGELHPLRDDTRPGLRGLPTIEASVDAIKAFDGLSIPVNVYLPKVDGSRRLPTIAIFHGGPFTSYAVRWNAYARFFVSLGYAVLEPNVRGSSGFGRSYGRADNLEKRADWLKDVESVNAWAKAQPWCDPTRVIVWGQSYGGYTTLMALTRQPALWRAGVDLYGPADLRGLLLRTNQAIRSVFVDEFGDVEKDRELLERFSPLKDAEKIAAPLFVYAGQNDPRVPRAESDSIVVALRRRGVPVEYMVAANEGHTVDRRETKIELLTRTARFLEDASGK
jgi:dipeptidyl aminopeptidase/acylaminoacyl peptidase